MSDLFASLPHNWFVAWPLWKQSVTMAAAVLVFRFLYKAVIVRWLLKIRDSYEYDFLDDLLNAFNTPIQAFLLIFAFYLFLIFSPLGSLSTHPSLDKIIRSTLVICIIWGIYNLCSAGHGFIVEAMHRANLNFDEGLADLISATTHILCIMLGFTMVAREWNYDISAFIASLGIGAMALAFAAKDSLANIFGSFIIILERPFTIGDWISANNVEGTVEKISFRSTCVRTFYQELVYIPNSLLSNTPITNFTKRQKYRIQISLGLTYDTTRQQLETVCQQIRQLCSGLDEIYSDGIDVNFFEFADSSLNIRIVCYSKAPNYSVYLNAREKIHLGIMRIMEENNVSCAFPSRSIYLATTPPQDSTKDLRNAEGVRIKKLPDTLPAEAAGQTKPENKALSEAKATSVAATHTRYPHDGTASHQPGPDR
ncbi:MAG: mechanosensitive ion channel family protein [Succiniclasticum sp.]|nr:mechanosensitive ion channel family protein [Succiniclasticum sp.]